MTNNSVYKFNKDFVYSLDDKKNKVNNNYLYIGAPGTGKTRSEFYNILHQTDRSHVIVDVKGSMSSLAPLLEKEEYNIYYLNLIQLDRSLSYNPLYYVRKEKAQLDLMSIARTLYGNRGHSKDPYWDESAIALLHAALTYTYEKHAQQEGEYGSLEEAIEILDLIEYKDDEIDTGKIREKITELQCKKLDVYTSKLFSRVLLNAPKTLLCILNSLHTSLESLLNPDVLGIMQKNEIDFREFTKKKSVLFLLVNDADTSLHSIVSVFLTQLFQSLYRQANKTNDLRLAIPVQFHLDDMATYRIKDFANIVASARSRGIGITGCIQSVSQLTALYDKDAINIQDCFDTTIYMGTNSYESSFDIANRSGFTIDYVNTLPIGNIIIIRRGALAQEVELLNYEKTGKYFIYNHKKYEFPLRQLDHKQVLFNNIETNYYDFYYDSYCKVAEWKRKYKKDVFK